jgi:tetratricopeptide (TPR) repeat protein
MDRIKNLRQTILICTLLAALTLLTFWPVLHYGFVNFDDNLYITSNSHVLGGLTLQNVAWAFRSSEVGNWHPLTWISHMLDVQMFGMNAGWHHLTSLLFHIANTLLLFRLLAIMTAAPWRSAVVAALFAIHPIHVESVAWLSERKDVLSTLFELLAISCFVAFVKQTQSTPQHTRRSPAEGTRPTATPKTSNPVGRVPPAGVPAPHPLSPLPSPLFFYCLSLAFFALGLMSKAMIVTLPFILLLLDFWPLHRFHFFKPTRGESGARWNASLPLIWEKLPFFALSAASSVLASLMLKQGGATRGLAVVSIGDRLANAAISCLWYLEKLIWPDGLAVFYPRPASWPTGPAVFAAAILAFISLVALRLLRRAPFVPVGWAWFIGGLVPVSGLIALGDHAMADRYTYFPAIGLFLAVVWGAWELLSSWRYRNLSLGVAAALVICLLAYGAGAQLKYWRSSRDLLEHDLAIAGESSMVHNNLGWALAAQSEWVNAETHFRSALRLDPNLQSARLNLAVALAQQDRTVEALDTANALTDGPLMASRHMLGGIFLEKGYLVDAGRQYAAAVQQDPGDASARQGLGMALARQGKTAEAVEQFTTQLRLRPDARAHYHLALAYVILGKADLAAEHYQEAIRLNPDWPEPLNDLAWMRATHPMPALRNGAEAVRLAERACELTSHKEARFLGTLDAAYAEAGRFADAINQAEKVRALVSASEPEVASAAEERLKLYKEGKPFRQVIQPAANP